MDFEQLVKRLDFLEKQQRDTKETLGSLSGQIASFETTVNAVSKQIKVIGKQVADITPATKRVEQFESMLTKQRSDLLNHRGKRKGTLKSRKGNRKADAGRVYRDRKSH